MTSSVTRANVLKHCSGLIRSAYQLLVDSGRYLWCTKVYVAHAIGHLHNYKYTCGFISHSLLHVIIILLQHNITVQLVKCNIKVA